MPLFIAPARRRPRERFGRLPTADVVHAFAESYRARETRTSPRAKMKRRFERIDESITRYLSQLETADRHGDLRTVATSVETR
jgi:hypothetical protein